MATCNISCGRPRTRFAIGDEQGIVISGSNFYYCLGFPGHTATVCCNDALLELEANPGLHWLC